MAATFVDYNGNQGTGTNNADFGFTFPSFKKQDVKVEVDNVVKTLDTHFTIPTYNVVSGGTVRFTAGNIPSLSTQKIRIFRETDVATDSGNYDPKAVFQAGSSIKADDLNNNFKQALFAVREEQEQTIQTHEIKDAAITTDKIKDLNVTTAKIADDAVTADKLANSINTAIAANTAKIGNATHTGEVTGATALTIAADAVTGAKIADNAIDSEHYVDGSIDHVHLANDAVDGDNIADDSINSEHYVDLSIDTQHVANENITTAKLANDAVTSSKLANDAVVTDSVVDANITTAKIADDAVTDAKIADGTLDGRYYTETELDAGQLDNRYFTETELTNGSLDGRYFTETELTNGALDGRYFTETEADARYFNISTGDTIKDGDTFPDNDTTIATTAAINDRIIDLVDDVGGFVPIANETSFPTTNPDVNNGAGTIVSVSAASTNLVPSGTTVTITNGAGTGNDVTITGVPTTITSGFGFLVETTTTLHTYTFHRLVPKATEVETVANISSNITTVANNTSNINAVAADASDIGIVAADGTDIGLVAGSISNVNTAAGSITNVNTTAGSIANVNTVAGAIANVNTTATNISSVNNVSSNISSVNNFGDLYQIASSNPSTDGGGNAVAEGDLYFNTTANRLKVYDGANWVDGVAAASGGGGVQTTGATFTGDVKLNDNVNLTVGTGNDLKILHDGSNSFIKDSGTGALIINTDAFQIKDQNNSTFALTAVPTSFVKLFFNNSTKLETTNTGIDVTGNIVVSGNVDGRDVAADGTKLDGIETGATADGGSNGIDFNDDVKVRFGTGNDLEIYHNGTDSYIDNPTGITRIRNTGTNGSQIQLLNSNQGIKIQGKTGEQSITALSNGKVELYYDNVKKFETTSSGATLTGTLTATGLIMGDNKSILLGDSDDFRIRHTGSHSEITDEGTGNLRLGSNQVIIGSPTFDETSAKFVDDGAVELYYDNSKKLETTSSGISVTGDIVVSGTVDGRDVASDGSKLDGIAAGATNVTNNNQLTNGAGYVTANTQLSNEQVQDIVGGMVSSNTESGITVTYQDSDGTLDFSVASQTDQNFTTTLKNKLDGIEAGATANQTASEIVALIANQTIAPSTIDMEDNERIKLGTSDDIQFYHDGSNSYIDHNGGGNLAIRANGTGEDIFIQANDDIRLQVSGSTDIIRCTGEGGVTLYANGFSRLETSLEGVTITGALSGIGVGKDIAVLRETASHAANGGTFSSGADRVRVLDSEEHDGESFVTLNTSTGEFTLPSGAYLIYFESVAFDVNNHRAKIVTDGGSTVLTGNNARSAAADATMTTSSGFGRVYNSSTEGYFLKHRCGSTKTTSGFGQDMNFDSDLEFYSTVVIMRMS